MNLSPNLIKNFLVTKRKDLNERMSVELVGCLFLDEGEREERK